MAKVTFRHYNMTTAAENVLLGCYYLFITCSD